MTSVSAAPGVVEIQRILIVRYACGHSFQQRPDVPIRQQCPCWPGQAKEAAG